MLYFLYPSSVSKLVGWFCSLATVNDSAINVCKCLCVKTRESFKYILQMGTPSNMAVPFLVFFFFFFRSLYIDFPGGCSSILSTAVTKGSWSPHFPPICWQLLTFRAWDTPFQTRLTLLVTEKRSGYSTSLPLPFPLQLFFFALRFWHLSWVLLWPWLFRVLHASGAHFFLLVCETF